MLRKQTGIQQKLFLFVNMTEKHGGIPCTLKCLSEFYLFQEKIETLKKQLAVNTTELSSYIRAKTSAKDDRPSAVSIGAVGVALLITVFGSIILIDSSMLVRDFMLFCKNIRGFFAE